MGGVTDAPADGPPLARLFAIAYRQLIDGLHCHRRVTLRVARVELNAIAGLQGEVQSLLELVAERILRFANIVGRERVIASTDCGLGGRIHPQIAWAKLEALAQGAAALLVASGCPPGSPAKCA